MGGEKNVEKDEGVASTEYTVQSYSVPYVSCGRGEIDLLRQPAPIKSDDDSPRNRTSIRFANTAQYQYRFVTLLRDHPGTHDQIPVYCQANFCRRFDIEATMESLMTSQDQYHLDLPIQ